MAYQYRGPEVRGGAPRKPKHNWTNKLNRDSRQRDRLLDKSKENYFKYDMEDLLTKRNVVEERRAALIATIFAKGSRNSIQEAKDFTKEKLDEGLIDETTFKTILTLIDGYSVWR